jgi:hypothetical protein
MRTGSPEQTTYWLPGAGDRLQAGSDRQSHDDRSPESDGNIAQTLTDLTDLSAKSGRASFESGEQRGGVGAGDVLAYSYFAWSAHYNGDECLAIV